MRCWFCRAALNLDWIHRDGIIRGRDESEGGPYRIYPCPSCRRENRIESLGPDRHYASPAKDLGLVDWLVGWIEPLAPSDFLKLQEWQQTYGEERRLLFEKAGLSSYSGLRWRQWLSRRQVEDPETSHRQAPNNEEKPHRRSEISDQGLPLNHPLQILGLSRNANSKQIRQRFRELVKQYHPDKHRSLSNKQVDEADEKLKQLIEAFEKLERDGKV
ncbi:MAG: hypothetical protein CBC13_01025 [Planctomycetia bacterium TMED53]|nr:MAG: hypothetical protein CBC13_01025 [Planctomycetia bacterium TMED53]